jgi:hypothetical protein
VGTTIRKTLEDVEQIARFQAPRYLACYSDIARFTLALQDEVEKAELIPDLTLSLEFGVRGPVQLGLMAMGLSRSSTLAISEVITEQLTPDEISRAQTNAAVLTRALSTLDLTEISLPALVREEVERAKVTLLQPRND